MKQNFTINDLTRFIYNETSASETIQIATAIHENSTLFAEYRRLNTAKKMLPKATFSPTKSAINNILKYSQTTALEAQY